MTDVNTTQDVPDPSDPKVIARLHAQRAAGERPEHIGPFRILETLGEGGMGVVYLAEQTKPIHRRVALKIIKLGMDTKQVIARFETEREALALMNHPNVAKVFDAGATDQGRPYFAMEYVPGTPITDYCDKHRLNTEVRLRLFIDVCHAIQHAHQKGIIHRDIKPSNVLVTEVDGKPVPKVIDFGIAKATEQRLGLETYFTETGQLVGTPAYMSPEQAGASPADIDTRTDVYSLGVLLYELLVGSRPFDDQMLRSAAISEIQRIIREVDPPKPSTRLSAVGNLSTTIAEHRGTHLRTLSRQIRGDLDWIVMKCLEKDRTRRYDTANGLAMEIQRYLDHEPVLAGPPSVVYRLHKFVGRNRGPVAAVAVVMLALTAGAVTSTVLYLRAESERQRAVEAEEQQSREREQAEAARDESETVTKFLSDMLSSVQPEEKGKDVSVRQVLDEAGKTVGEALSRQPLVEARLSETIGLSYYSLGLFSEAERRLLDAATIYRRILGERHGRTLACLTNLAKAMAGRGGFSTSEALLRSTLEIQRRVLGDEHRITLVSMNNLAAVLSDQGKYAEAENLNRRTLDIRRRVLGEEDRDTLMSMNNLGNALGDQGKYVESEELFRKTLDIQRRVLGVEHPETLAATINLATQLLEQGKFEEAESLYRRNLEILRRILGEQHPRTLMSMSNLGNVVLEQGKYMEAEALDRHALEIARRVLGEQHPITAGLMTNLAGSLSAQLKYAEAESLNRQTLEIERRVLGEEHPNTLRSMDGLAHTAWGQGKYAEAEILYRETLSARSRILGVEHPDTLTSMQNLASLLDAQKRYLEAEELLRKTLDLRRRILGEEHPYVAHTLQSLASVLEKIQQFADAERLCRRARVIWEGKLPPGHRNLIRNDQLLGAILAGQGHRVEGERLMLTGYEALNSDPGVSARDNKESLEHLVRLYESWDAAEPGKGHAEKAAEWRAKLEETPKNENVETPK